MKKCLNIKLNEDVYRLRLTLAGQKALRDRFNEDTLQTALSAAVDGERMAAVLGEALSWKGSGNPTTDGEELYDLLVDNDYAGQADFGKLALSIAAKSGLITEKQAASLIQSLTDTVDEAFEQLDGQSESVRKAQEAPRPTAEAKA